MAFRQKDGVVTKALLAASFFENLSLNDTFEEVFPTIENECDDRAKAGFAVFVRSQFAQELFGIGPGIAVRAGIAG